MFIIAESLISSPSLFSCLLACLLFVCLFALYCCLCNYWLDIAYITMDKILNTDRKVTIQVFKVNITRGTHYYRPWRVSQRIAIV